MKILEWLATVLTVAGFALLSFDQTQWGFAVSMLGNIAWMVWADSKDANGIFTINFILFIAGLNGLGLL